MVKTPPSNAGDVGLIPDRGMTKKEEEKQSASSV